MIKSVPLTVLPLIAYNLVGYGLSGADPWAAGIVVVPMPSGALWTLTIGDLLVAFGFAMFYVDVTRLAHAPRGAIVHRTLAVLVLIVYVAEFLAADAAAHSVFFLLTTIAIFDVVAGFSIRRGRHDRPAEQYLDEAP
jgi:hypothetical protein